MRLDTDRLRAEIEALPEGPERDAATNSLEAAEQHLRAAEQFLAGASTMIDQAKAQAEREATADG